MPNRRQTMGVIAIVKHKQIFLALNSFFGYFVQNYNCNFLFKPIWMKVIQLIYFISKLAKNQSIS